MIDIYDSCEYCGKSFVKVKNSRRFCSNKCSQRARNGWIDDPFYSCNHGLSYLENDKFVANAFRYIERHKR